MVEFLSHPALFPVLAALLGLCLGSFYNVCVHRFLTGQSVIAPASHCPACGHILSWWENIPLLSYLLLGGRCRGCQEHISWRYPALEFLSALLALLFALRFGPGAPWLVSMIFLGIFLVASFIDLEAGILPDRLTWPAAVLAWASPLVLPVGWLDMAWGSLCGAGIFLTLQQTYLRWRKLDALGSGDIKLMLSLGALAGLSRLPYLILIAAVSALLAALFYYLRRPSGAGWRTSVPFGPFLCLGTVACLLWV